MGGVAHVRAYKGCQARASAGVGTCLPPPKQPSHSALNVTALIAQPMSLLQTGRKQSFLS